jgi:hypothetical protein
MCEVSRRDDGDPNEKPREVLQRLREAAEQAVPVEVPNDMQAEWLRRRKLEFLRLWEGFDQETRAAFLRRVSIEQRKSEK